MADEHKALSKNQSRQLERCDRIVRRPNKFDAKHLQISVVASRNYFAPQKLPARGKTLVERRNLYLGLATALALYRWSRKVPQEPRKVPQENNIGRKLPEENRRWIIEYIFGRHLERHTRKDASEQIDYVRVCVPGRTR